MDYGYGVGLPGGLLCQWMLVLACARARARAWMLVLASARASVLVHVCV